MGDVVEKNDKAKEEKQAEIDDMKFKVATMHICAATD